MDERKRPKSIGDYRAEAAAPTGMAPLEGEEGGFEELIPDALWDAGQEEQRRKKRKRRRIALVCALGCLILLFGGAFLYLRSLMGNPSSYFDQKEVFSATTTATPTPMPGATPTPTLDPYTMLAQQADLSMMQNIVNIMLIGVDYAAERETWSGKDGLTASHADVMIVLAVNFDENTADMISLPRDTYATIPGVSGIYKLNAALDCGGGLNAENGAGFLKVCEAASWMLGGIPVNHYYAVTMPAVKQLVDAIGGVEYDLEISFKMQGRSYTAGRQHMNGQAVLDYLRVRKSGTGLSQGETGDANRVNRQKKMLVAIFEKIKGAGLMVKIPEILSAFDGQLFTNCTANQTAALALYGYNMPKENIGMYSMSGPTKNLYTWNFCFPSPKTRRDIVKTVYGVDVETLRDCTREYAVYLYNAKLAAQYLDTCAGLTGYVSRLIANDDMLPVMPTETIPPIWDTPAPPPVVTPAPTPTMTISTPEPTPEPTPEFTPDPGAFPTSVPEGEGGIPAEGGAVGMRPGLGGGLLLQRFLTGPALQEEYRRYTDDQRAIYYNYIAAYDNCRNTLEAANRHAQAYLRFQTSEMGGYDTALAEACAALQSWAFNAASAFGYGGGLSWDIPPLAKTNEIYVDFR